MHGKYHHFFGYVNGAFIHLRSWLGLKVERLSGEGEYSWEYDESVEFQFEFIFEGIQ